MKDWLNNILDVLRRWLGVWSPSLERQGYYRCDNCKYYNEKLYRPCVKLKSWTAPHWCCRRFKPRRKNK